MLLKKTVHLKQQFIKNVHLKVFWTLFKNVQRRGPCSLRPCISRPYCTNLPMISDIDLPKTVKKNRKYPGQKIILTLMFWNENTAWKLGLMEPSLLFWICLSNLLWGGPSHWTIQQEPAEDICKIFVPNRWKKQILQNVFISAFFCKSAIDCKGCFI